MSRVVPDPTAAKTIALHFLKLTTDRITPVIVARTVVQVKEVLAEGYSKQEIMKVIDYILAKRAGVYSFNYISASINDALREMEQEEARIRYEAEAKIAKAEMTATLAEDRKKVSGVDDATERNRSKARGFGVQSRERKKPYFDMFERDGQAD